MNNEVITLTEEDVPGARLMKNVSECSVIQLKRWLECRGQKKTGKKPELQARVTACMNLNLTIDPKVDGGRWYEVKSKPSSISNNTSSSKELPKDGWNVFPSATIPSMFNYGHVYHYLVESCSAFALSNNDEDSSDVEDSVTAKPLRKGRALVTSGFIENIEDLERDMYYYIRAHVHHSMKNDVPLYVSVALSKLSGFISHCKCTCKASALQRCAHISALLIYISDYVSNEENHINVPSTSRPCEWNKGKKRGRNPSALKDSFYQSSAAKRQKSKSDIMSFDPRPRKFINNSDKEKVNSMNKFVSELNFINASQDKTSMWETIFYYNYSDFELDQEDKFYYFHLIETFEDSTIEYVHDLVKNISINGKSCEVPNTKSQSDSHVWHQQRWCRVTASICKEIVSKVENLNMPLKKQQLFNWFEKKFWFKRKITTFDIQYGIENEPNALKLYAKKNNVIVSESGLWLHRKYPFLGASPDGLIFANNKLIGIIEIKCLKIFRKKTPSDILKLQSDERKSILKNQCFDIVNGKIVLCHSHSYYYQIQLQLLITKAAYCDFVLYSGLGEIHVQRVYSDLLIQSKIVRNCYKFWKLVLIPEYFLQRVPRRLCPIVFDF